MFLFRNKHPDETIKNWLHKITSYGNSFKKVCTIELTELKTAPLCFQVPLYFFLSPATVPLNPEQFRTVFLPLRSCFMIKPSWDIFEGNVNS